MGISFSCVSKNGQVWGRLNVFLPSSGPFFTNQLYKTEEQQNYFPKEPGPNFGPMFQLNPFCGSVKFSQLWVFSVFTSAFPSLLLSNFQVKMVAPKSP